MLAVRSGLVPDKLTVLLVDDEVLIRLMIADELRSEGLRVLEASNAEEALTILESSLPIHLLFTDVQMPGRMDGLSLARIARTRFPHVRRIIASSGLPDAPIVEVADAFLSKPYDLHRVIEQVERLLTQT